GVAAAARGVARNTNLPCTKVARFVNESTVEVIENHQTRTIVRGGRCGEWTFMGSIAGRHNYAIMEDFQSFDGRMLFVDTDGVRVGLSKSAESNIENAGP